MKQCVVIVLTMLCFCAASMAQPGIDGNSNYTQGQQRNAREWADKERHYNSMKSGSSGSNAAINGNYNAYGWADYGRMNEINAASRRIKAREDAYNAKVQKMNQLLSERNIILSKENWSKIRQAGRDAGFDDDAIRRTYGNYDPDYKPAPDGYYDWSGNYLGPAKQATTANAAPASKANSLSDLTVSQRESFQKYLANAKAEENLYFKIELLKQALKIYEDPSVQLDLAQLYIQKREYLNARSMLFDCKRNPITQNRPSGKTLIHLGAYTHLIESDYGIAEDLYYTIYSAKETNKEIICETASVNFHLGAYDYVYDIMKNANANNPENKITYSLAGAAILAIDSSFANAEKLFSSVATFEQGKDLNKQIAKKLYNEVQAYRRQTGKVTVVTVFLLDLAVKLEPQNIDYRAERYDSNAFLGRKKETTIDEPFLK
jgi:hypothetical protein